MYGKFYPTFTTRIHRRSLLIKQPGMAHGMIRFYPPRWVIAKRIEARWVQGGSLVAASPFWFVESLDLVGFLGCCLGGDTQKNGSLVVEMKKPGCFFGVFGEDVSPLKRWWIFQPALLVYQRVWYIGIIMTRWFKSWPNCIPQSLEVTKLHLWKGSRKLTIPKRSRLESPGIWCFFLGGGCCLVAKLEII